MIQPHQLPKEEDVTEIDIGDVRVLVVYFNDDNREGLVDMIMAMNIGTTCKFCGKRYDTLEDLRGVVFAGPHAGGDLACKTCWENQRGDA